MTPPEHQEYPKLMTHPHFRPATLGTSYDERTGKPATKGAPMHMPPVTVYDETQEEYHASLGYAPAGKSNPAAFVAAHAAPVMPDAPRYDYPKWIADDGHPRGGVEVADEQEEAAYRAEVAARPAPVEAAPEAAPSSDIAPLQARVAAMESNLSAIAASLAALTAALAPQPEAPAKRPYNRRAKPDTMAPDTSSETGDGDPSL